MATPRVCNKSMPVACPKEVGAKLDEWLQRVAAAGTQTIVLETGLEEDKPIVFASDALLDAGVRLDSMELLDVVDVRTANAAEEWWIDAYNEAPAGQVVRSCVWSSVQLVLPAFAGERLVADVLAELEGTAYEDAGESVEVTIVISDVRRMERPMSSGKIKATLRRPPKYPSRVGRSFVSALGTVAEE